MKKNTLIIAAVAAGLLIVGLVVVLFYQRSQISAIQEMAEWEKEQLENEYEDLAIQFDGYQGMEIRNDSLQDLLSKEQQRVQDLLEELKITKATNARRIVELKKELATVRAVMAQYVAQIDSLNRDNQRLTAENIEFRQQAVEATETARMLSIEKEKLTETVNRAAMLEVSDFSLTMLNKYNKKTRILSHAVKLQFDYTVHRNITAKTGLKQVYICIIAPDGELIVTDSTNVFLFEGTEVAYTLAHEIEYSGEEMRDTQYFRDEGFVKGIYNADFFIDEQLVGSFPFELK